MVLNVANNYQVVRAEADGMCEENLRWQAFVQSSQWAVMEACVDKYGHLLLFWLSVNGDAMENFVTAVRHKSGVCDAFERWQRSLWSLCLWLFFLWNLNIAPTDVCEGNCATLCTMHLYAMPNAQCGFSLILHIQGTAEKWSLRVFIIAGDYSIINSAPSSFWNFLFNTCTCTLIHLSLIGEENYLPFASSSTPWGFFDRSSSFIHL